jgi:hypothetical protein
MFLRVLLIISSHSSSRTILQITIFCRMHQPAFFLHTSIFTLEGCWVQLHVSEAGLFSDAFHSVFKTTRILMMTEGHINEVSVKMQCISAADDNSLIMLISLCLIMLL